MAGLTTRLVCSIIKSVCRCGGTGRRKGLKIPRWQQRTGSIPVGGTESKRNARTLVFAFLFAFYVCQVLWLGRHKRETSAKLSAKNAWNGRQRDQNIPRFKGKLLVFSHEFVPWKKVSLLFSSTFAPGCILWFGHDGGNRVCGVALAFRIKVRIDIGGGRIIGMSQPDLHLFHGNIVF